MRWRGSPGQVENPRVQRPGSVFFLSHQEHPFWHFVQLRNKAFTKLMCQEGDKGPSSPSSTPWGSGSFINFTQTHVHWLFLNPIHSGMGLPGFKSLNNKRRMFLLLSLSNHSTITEISLQQECSSHSQGLTEGDFCLCHLRKRFPLFCCCCCSYLLGIQDPTQRQRLWLLAECVVWLLCASLLPFIKWTE